jgi:hypothetical protein
MLGGIVPEPSIEEERPHEPDRPEEEEALLPGDELEDEDDEESGVNAPPQRAASQVIAWARVRS